MVEVATIGHVLYDIRCYVDEFPKPDKTSFIQSSIRGGGGGSAANVAASLKLLGHDSAFIGNVGTDRHGKYLIHDLHRHGVDTRGVNIVSGDTGVSIVLVNKRAEVEVVQMLGVSEPIKGIDENIIREAKALHMTSCNVDALLKAGAVARKAGLLITFDPGRSISRLGTKRLAQVLKYSDYLIVNRHELAHLTGMNDTVKAARKVAKAFDVTCVIKAGKEPVIVEGRSSFTSPPFKVKPVDTIGAGDAFCSGLLAGMLEGETLENSVRLANAVAAAKVMLRGARPHLKREEIEEKFGV
ncbi:putative sugar kinase [Candidatus Burarchaeum australiense]|nr:putative sugar kinase [Candidatus Burarchaeum australiense]